MTAVSYDNLRTRALQVMNETAGFANSETRVGSLFRDMVDSLSNVANRFSVATYIAAGTGSLASPAAAFAAADAAAAAVGGTVYVPAGTYGDGTDWSFALSSGVKLEGDGDASVLVKCYLTCTGTAGAEIPFTAPAAKGATSISIPATGLTGSWLRLASVINVGSTDAGRDQLGHLPSEENYFAEYACVKTGNAGTADLMGALQWAYSNTPGADTDASITTSVARVMSFHEGGRIKRIKFLGKNSAQARNIVATFCRNLVIEDVTVDTNDTTSRCVQFQYCLECKILGGFFYGKRTSVPAGSTANPIYISASQNCLVDGAVIRFGNQGIDIAQGFQDLTYRGGPSISCIVANCMASDCATEGFTSHQSNWGTQFRNCTTRGSQRGVRLRDRASSATGCKLVGDGANGIGVYVTDAAVVDALVADNVIHNFLYGVNFAHSAAGYEALEVLLQCGSARIARNHIRDSAEFGIYLTTGYTAATLMGPAVVDNEVHNSVSDAIKIQSYNNGTFVGRNRIVGVATTKAGIRWEDDISHLHIAPNHIYGVNATGFGIVGPGIAVCIVDTVTFPGGNADAKWVIERQFTDAASGFMQASVIRDVAAYAPATVPGYQPNVMPMGTSGPTAERQTFGFYLSGSQLRADTRDTSNAFVTHMAVIRNSGTPEGSVTSGIGGLCIDTATGILYAKTSGTGNTGWVKVSAT